MNWQINAGFIVLGVLFLAIFVWRAQKPRLLGSSDIILIGLGIGALILGLLGLSRVV